MMVYKKTILVLFPLRFCLQTYGLNIFHRKCTVGQFLKQKLIFFFSGSVFIELLSKNYGKTSSYLGVSVSWDLSKKKKYRTVNINFKNLFNRRNRKFTWEIKKANQHSSSIKNSYATIFNNTFHRFCLFLYIIFFFFVFMVFFYIISYIIIMLDEIDCFILIKTLQLGAILNPLRRRLINISS